VQAHPHLSLPQVHYALSYYYEHAPEINADLLANEQYIEQSRATHSRSASEEKYKCRIEPLVFTNWSEALGYLAKLQDSSEDKDHWVFRGCSSSNWKLQSSLERVCDQLGIEGKVRPKWELGLLRKFKRQYQRYGLSTPRDDDIIEWFSLMQHYGAPTRLLDFSHSLFVATYFALKELPPIRKSSNKDGEDCVTTEEYPVVWAINQKQLDDAFKAQYPNLDRVFSKSKDAWTWDSFNRVFALKTPLRFVRTTNPYRLNERLVVQQGLFLCSGDISASFEKNLGAMFGTDPPIDRAVKIILKFELAAWKEALIYLQRMNMTAATLFPGLDGFAQSLRTQMVFWPKMFPPDPELASVAPEEFDWGV
jgi:hypothetical protein